LTTFDGEKSAISAGYGVLTAQRIWSVLLSAPSIKRRLSELRWGGSVPNLEPTAVLKALSEETFAETDDLWPTNPFTGKRSICLSRAKPEHFRQIIAKTKSVTRGGVTTVTEENTMAGGRAHLGIVARVIGVMVTRPSELQAQSGGRAANEHIDDNLVERLARLRAKLNQANQ
jgi:phage terminase small subunit